MPKKPTETAKKRKPKSRGNGEGSIYKRPDGRWVAQLTLGFDGHGKQLRKAVYGATRAEVAQKLSDLSFKAQRANVKPSDITVGQWLEEYMRSKAVGLRPGTVRGHMGYAKILNEHLGTIKLQKLSAPVLQAMYTTLAESYSSSTYRHIHHFLNGALRRALKQGLIFQNPGELVEFPKPKVKQSTATAWTPEEVQKFLQANREHRFWPLFYTLLTTGLRIGELLALDWTDLKGDRLDASSSMSIASTEGGARVKASTKTQKSTRVITLAPDLLDVLKIQREQVASWKAAAGPDWTETGAMFPTMRGTRLLHRNVMRDLHQMTEVAGVRRIRLHDLRHTYTSLAISAGLDPKLVADRLGHADVSLTLKVYRQIQDAERTTSALTLDTLLQGKKATGL